MKAKVGITPSLEIEVDATSPKELIKLIASYQSVMSDVECGSCRSTKIVFEHRQHDNVDFFGRRCLDCSAQLSFGQHRSGDTLFVKADKGWHHWKREEKVDDEW